LFEFGSSAEFKCAVNITSIYLEFSEFSRYQFLVLVSGFGDLLRQTLTREKSVIFVDLTTKKPTNRGHRTTVKSSQESLNNGSFCSLVYSAPSI
jgi:hypothetical protein